MERDYQRLYQKKPLAGGYFGDFFGDLPYIVVNFRKNLQNSPNVLYIGNLYAFFKKLFRSYMTSFQPSFNLDVRQEASLDDFDAQHYHSIVQAVKKLCLGELTELYIFGEKYVGKTHLALSIYNTYTANQKNAISLSLAELIDEGDVDALNNLELFDLVILDDLQAISNNDTWQEALFHLINRIRAQHKQLVFLADNPARELDIELLDLVTRLSLTPMLELSSSTNESDRASLLNAILRRKSWRLPEGIFEYLVKEGPHTAGEMLTVLESISPLLTNLSRPQVPKKIIEEAKAIIERKTLLLEISRYTSEDLT